MTDTLDFEAWPKTPRYRREVTITEKIDGTNGAVIVTEGGQVGAQSRNRLVTPEADNYGFARWVRDNAEALADVLGPGRHFGEWWGSGIQRRYGLANGERRFSLFNVTRYETRAPILGRVPGLGIVPVLATGVLSDRLIDETLTDLSGYGSIAAPGFMDPEGIIIHHSQADKVFKVLLANDDRPKGAVAA